MAYYCSYLDLPADGSEYSNNCIDGRCSNCGECCSDLLPLTDGEVSKLKRYAQAHNLKEHRQAPFFDPKATDLTCPFRNEQTKRCDVYPVRPLICRSSSAQSRCNRRTTTETLFTRAVAPIPYGMRYSVILKRWISFEESWRNRSDRKSRRYEMEQLIKQAKTLVAEELQRAAKKHGQMLHSAHEAYAVILEERDEGIENVAALDKSLDQFWAGITSDSLERQNDALGNIEETAVLVACEYIQVAAMARKARYGYDKGV